MYALKQFDNGFEYLEVKNESAYAKIALQGAHIFSYKVKEQEEFLWLSASSKFENGSAIRGGIPICWPRFGNLDDTLPQHGFVRVFLFELEKVQELSLEQTKVYLRLQESEKSRKIWDFKFELQIIFTITNRLKIEMITTNTDTKAFFLTQAFHTYFQVSDIHNIIIEGLKGKTYLDILDNEKKVQKENLRINQEVDRVYENVSNEIILHDLKKKTSIKSENSSSVIIWNPWIDKCKTMSAMDAQGYKKFVCIESANAFDDFQIIKPKETYSLEVIYT
ncbi:D-hexose-6-phosphate mutarotase [Sulfurimonas autotrophica]|uniref:Putative glucose-6-phosphate 1-epimerase n=1 Tax=Sulfurimonas autotrophica (strain ATCC BAA-671 / DSM 16294 / JCM 11897 / OK10) TaxID=563040 RepID=E0UT96_SULAO|nr:D-hexose-6-phosphate mutarotase [Sulfurimonas autotrophica]ADN08199.1 Aldose 1-epimerase [Sulfurimonas autotrophica DSM 16294]